MLCSREIFTDQRYHACIRSEKNPSIRSDACMTADYARGQPASAWPLASKPCRVDCDLHTIARAHNNTFFVRPIETLGPMWLQSNVLLCVRRSCTVHHQNLCQNGTFSSSSNRGALYIRVNRYIHTLLHTSRVRQISREIPAVRSRSEIHNFQANLSQKKYFKISCICA